MLLLPEALAFFTELETLKASQNFISVLEHITPLSNLTRVDLRWDSVCYTAFHTPNSPFSLHRRNQLRELPPEISKLPLEYLHLSYNRLKSLPDEIGDIKSLCELVGYHG